MSLNLLVGLPLLLHRHDLMRRRRRERVYRSRVSLFGMSSEEVLHRYRFPPHILMDMVFEWEQELDPHTARAHALPAYVKVLAAIHFFATGSFQRVSGDVNGISQTSQSRCVHQVLRCLLRRAHRYIGMPLTQAGRQCIAREFYAIAQFPRVLGALDCTHVALQPPQHTAHLYRNRHRRHSINVQAVCDARGIFLDVYAVFPGSTHDSYIYRRSPLAGRQVAGEFGNMWLIGDAAYALSPYVLTPFRQPTTAPQQRYNRAHIRTRAIIERTFGLLKTRFRCLDRSGGVLLYAPAVVSDIIVACCVLHNIAVRGGIHIPTDPEVQPHPLNHAEQRIVGQGVAVRNELVQCFFQ